MAFSFLTNFFITMVESFLLIVSFLGHSNTELKKNRHLWNHIQSLYIGDHFNDKVYDKVTLKGYCATNQKLASMFVLYLKIINTFFKNDIYILKQIVQGTQNDIEILVDQVTFKIKTVKLQ